MKCAICLGLILVILPNAFAGFSPSQYVEIDLQKLKIEKPLVENFEAEKTFQTMLDKLSDDEEEGNEPYNAAFLGDFMRFISQHPKTVSALTAKLYLGQILVDFCFSHLDDEFTSDNIPLKKIRDDALAIFQSLSREFPDTWQGKTASIVSPENFALHFVKDKAVLLPILQAELPLIQELDKEPQFWKLRETLYGTYGSGEEEVRYRIINYLLDLKRWKEAKDEFEIFRAKFPQISWVEELARRMKTGFR